jgi:hypothetical protein
LLPLLVTELCTSSDEELITELDRCAQTLAANVVTVELFIGEVHFHTLRISGAWLIAAIVGNEVRGGRPSPAGRRVRVESIRRIALMSDSSLQKRWGLRLFAHLFNENKGLELPDSESSIVVKVMLALCTDKDPQVADNAMMMMMMMTMHNLPLTKGPRKPTGRALRLGQGKAKH